MTLKDLLTQAFSKFQDLQPTTTYGSETNFPNVVTPLGDGPRPTIPPRREATPTPTPLPGTPDSLVSTFQNAARGQVTPALLSAVARAESQYNPHAQSPVGAQGMMQFMPQTVEEVQRRGFGAFDPQDPGQSASAAAFYLDDLFRQFNTLEEVLAAYNAGPGNVRRYGGIPPFPETQNYVQKIKAYLGE